MPINRRIAGIAVLVLLGVAGVAAVTWVITAWLASDRRPLMLITPLVGTGALLGAIGGFVIIQLKVMRDMRTDQRLVRDRTLQTQRRVSEIASSIEKNRRALRGMSETQLPRLIGVLESAGLGSLREDVIQQIRANDARAVQAIELLRQAADRLASADNEATRHLVDEMHRSVDLTVRQIGALHSVYSVLSPNAPLAPFGGWAVSPDAAAHLVRSIHERRPELVVEAGSGLSTVLIGLCLRTIGGGRLVSLEHDPEYWEATKRSLELHELEDVVDLVLAPLKSIVLGADSWIWYDVTEVHFDQPIGMVVVDGPPGVTGQHARYPALPVLAPHLAPGSVVLLDDANRQQEREIVERWVSEYPDFSARILEHDRGTAELIRSV